MLLVSFSEGLVYTLDATFNVQSSLQLVICPDDISV